MTAFTVKKRGIIALRGKNFISDANFSSNISLNFDKLVEIDDKISRIGDMCSNVRGKF